MCKIQRGLQSVRLLRGWLEANATVYLSIKVLHAAIRTRTQEGDRQILEGAGRAFQVVLRGSRGVGNQGVALTYLEAQTASEDAVEKEVPL